jgi:ABC-type transporter Mla subunit MlaD
VQTVDQTLSRINSIDFKGIADQVTGTLETMRTAVREADLPAISSEVRSVLAEARSLVGDPRLDSFVGSLDGSGRKAEEAMAELRGNMRRLGSVLARIDSAVAEHEDEFRTIVDNLNATSGGARRFVNRGGELLDEARGTMHALRTRLLNITKELERSSEHLNQILEQVRMQPSQLLFSQPPRRRGEERSR